MRLLRFGAVQFVLGVCTAYWVFKDRLASGGGIGASLGDGDLRIETPACSPLRSRELVRVLFSQPKWASQGRFFSDGFQWLKPTGNGRLPCGHRGRGSGAGGGAKRRHVKTPTRQNVGTAKLQNAGGRELKWGRLSRWSAGVRIRFYRWLSGVSGFRSAPKTRCQTDMKPALIGGSGRRSSYFEHPSTARRPSSCQHHDNHKNAEDSKIGGRK